MRSNLDMGKVLRATLLTLLAATLNEILFGRLLNIPSPVAILAVVAYVAFVWGLHGGLVSAALASAYSLYFYRSTGALLDYTPNNALRALMLVITAFAIATLVGSLRRNQQTSHDALREQLVLSEALAQSLGEGVYAVDAEGRVTFINPAAERALGYSRQEILGKQVHDLIHFQGADGTRVPVEECPLMDVSRSGTPYAAQDDVFTRKGGEIFSVDYTSSPIVIDGKVMGAVVAFRDVSARKEAEQDARRQTEYLSALHDTTLALVNRLEPTNLLQDIIARAGALVGTQHGYIYLLNPYAQELQVTVGTGIFQEYVSSPIKLGEGLAGRVWESGEPIVVDNYDAWEGRLVGFGRGIMQAAVGLPLRSGSEVVGVLALAYTEQGRTFGPNEISTLSRFAELASVVLENARLYTSARQEIAERERVEAALRESEDRFQVAITGANDGIWDWNVLTDEVYLSPRWKEMIGYSDEELPNRFDSWRECVHPDDLKGALAALQSYLRGETPVFELEHRLQHKDGSYRWILSRGASVRDASGKLYRMAGSHTDITERRKAEDELRRSEANLAASQRIAHLGSWEWDVIANEEHWSDEVYRIFGYTPQQFTPTYDIFLSCLHPDDRAVVIQAVEDALDNKHPYHVEHRIVRPDGTERTVLEQAEVVFDEGGSRVRMIGTVQDITERKRAEEQHNELLAQVERALEIRNQFLSIASHELKTPVTLLKGYAQLIEEKARQRNDTSYQKPIATINRQVDRMTQLINDLLDVSRIESGKVEFDMQPFDLNLAVEEIVHEIEATMPGLKLELEQQAEGVWVYGDRIRIQQVITNLVTNAVKYSDKSKDVNVCVQREAAKALVTVTDRGIGIPDQQQAQVFNLYFRGANASANNYGGLGLGLYISKTILDRHGGEIGLHSEEGVGSTFYFSLPIHASTHPSAQADKDLAASL